jgi:hypothetical protein
VSRLFSLRDRHAARIDRTDPVVLDAIRTDPVTPVNDNVSMTTYHLSMMSDVVLTAELSRLAACQRETGAQLVAHLAEFDARRLYLGAGHASLFSYCCKVLRLSEGGAYNRIEAARAASRFPAILEMLAEGSFTLATARLLAPHLTVENAEIVLGAAAFKSKRAVEEIVARLAPQADVPSSIRKLPGRRANSTPAAASEAPSTAAAASEAPATAATVPLVSCSFDGAPPPERDSRDAASNAAELQSIPAVAQRSASPQPSVTPLAPERYQVRFTASASTYQKLRSAQDLLRHAIPDGDVATIFDRALTLLLEALARRKFAACERPRRREPSIDGTSREDSTASRLIPADVKRQVWCRDGGRCAFSGSEGNRCEARGFLEFHHERPFAAGGQASVENISLRCRAHNRYEAGVYFREIWRGRDTQLRSAGP